MAGRRKAAAQVTLTVFDAETAAALEAQAANVVGSAGKLRLHVKVNTGMNRLGVRPADAPDLLRALARLPHLDVQGIFTHFATSDESDRSYAELQFRRFRYLLESLAASGGCARPSHTRPTLPRCSPCRTRTWTWCAAASHSTGGDPDCDQCPLPGGFAPRLAVEGHRHPHGSAGGRRPGLL